MKRMLSLSSLLMIGILCVASLAVAGPLETCVQAALKGPEKKRVKVLEHHWNCKPIDSLALQGNKYQVFGRGSCWIPGS
jgi:hypothetical protein